MNNLFEVATRNKFRFAFKGMLSVEDLWDLYVEDLDVIYKNLMSDKKKAQEESLLQTKSKEQSELDFKIEIVKYIVNIKLEEKDNIMKAKEKKEQKQRIMAILNEKEDNELKNKTVEELKAMLETLE